MAKARTLLLAAAIMLALPNMFIDKHMKTSYLKEAKKLLKQFYSVFLQISKLYLSKKS